MELIRALVLLLGLLVCSSQPQHLEVVYQWKYLDWVWPNIHLTGKNYTLGNAFTQDVDIDRQGRVFVTSPQWLEGVPISLSLVTKGQGPGGRLLVPYPNWSWHTSFNCDSIISVYRVAVISQLCDSPHPIAAEKCQTLDAHSLACNIVARSTFLRRRLDVHEIMCLFSLERMELIVVNDPSRSTSAIVYGWSIPVG